jgi:hypothetical protein
MSDDAGMRPLHQLVVLGLLRSVFNVEEPRACSSFQEYSDMRSVSLFQAAVEKNALEICQYVEELNWGTGKQVRSYPLAPSLSPPADPLACPNKSSDEMLIRFQGS